MVGRVLLDDGDIKDIVISLTEDNKVKDVAFVHCYDYYTRINIVVEKGYERILYYLSLDGEVEEIQIVEGLSVFKTKTRVGYEYQRLVQHITNLDEIDCFWEMFVDNPDWR